MAAWRSEESPIMVRRSAFPPSCASFIARHSGRLHDDRACDSARFPSTRSRSHGLETSTQRPTIYSPPPTKAKKIPHHVRSYSTSPPHHYQSMQQKNNSTQRCPCYNQTTPWPEKKEKRKGTRSSNFEEKRTRKPQSMNRQGKRNLSGTTRDF